MFVLLFNRAEFIWSPKTGLMERPEILEGHLLLLLFLIRKVGAGLGVATPGRQQTKNKALI